MASPQKEEGFTSIANELLEAFCTVQLSGHEWSIVHAVIRKTYGYNKKSDWIAGSQLGLMTNLSKQRVYEAKKKLLEKNILLQNGKKLSLNKDYEQWKESNGKTLLGNGKTLPKVTENRTHKRKKENIQKKGGEQSSQPDLLNNKKTMGWGNNKGDDFDEGVVDYDSMEMTNPEEEAKGKNKEQNARKKELVDWLIAYQNRDPLRTNRPKQLKALNRLIEMRVTGAEAQQMIMEEMQSEFWRGKKEKPDFCTVVAIIEKRGE